MGCCPEFRKKGDSPVDGLERVVICKLAERQKLIPVGLAVIDKGSQGVLHHPVHAL